MSASSDSLQTLRPSEVLNALSERGTTRGTFIGVAANLNVGLGLVLGDSRFAVAGTADQLRAVARDIEEVIGPRWVWWDHEMAAVFARDFETIAHCWDVLTVHRLIHGGWRTSIAKVWAALHHLDVDSMPQMGQLGLLDTPSDEGLDAENPMRPDGHLRPEWLSGGWQATPDRLSAWAALALQAATMQHQALSKAELAGQALMTAKSESAADLLCAEMELCGLPLHEPEAIRIIQEAAGPRPHSDSEEAQTRAVRDELVLRHVPGSRTFNLRNPDDVKSMLRRIEVELPDTRAWRLEQIRDQHPLIEALLKWRKDERISTTYGYRWLDESVDGGRLRGDWTASDGAAGRMTASAGLHNLPTEMRTAIRADQGFLFVRADLGQIEPRVLAAVSGDPALARATQDDDLYQPVAERLNVDREVAKVAVLGAMYGATTGESAHALRGLEAAYPRAMTHLRDAAELGSAGQDVFTIGGRRVRMWTDASVTGDIERARTVAAARGRFARNAIIQGAAAEFFKVWAVLVRSRVRHLGGAVVLCLHDEILVHVPADQAKEVSGVVADAVTEAAHFWSPTDQVRFLAQVSVISLWSQAKD